MIPLRDETRSQRRPFVTWLLIAANIAVFILQLRDPHGMMEQYALYPARLIRGDQLYAILSSMFMHGGIAHILGNMWFLYIFGDNVEDVLGHFRYILFYLLAGVCGALLQVLVSSHSTIPMVGASGAISGVLGAYLVLFPGARILTLLPIFIFIQFVNIPAWIFLGYWILIQVLSGMGAPRTGGGVAFFAHIGGFAFGFLVALFARRRRNRNSTIHYTIR